jgi:hypothetical protein
MQLLKNGEQFINWTEKQSHWMKNCNESWLILIYWTDLKLSIGSDQKSVNVMSVLTCGIVIAEVRTTGPNDIKHDRSILLQTRNPEWLDSPILQLWPESWRDETTKTKPLAFLRPDNKCKRLLVLDASGNHFAVFWNSVLTLYPTPLILQRRRILLCIR